MARCGLCKSCWWWQPLPAADPGDTEDKGQCWMHSRYTKARAYCPDWISRRAERGKTLEEFIKAKEERRKGNETERK